MKKKRKVILKVGDRYRNNVGWFIIEKLYTDNHPLLEKDERERVVIKYEDIDRESDMCKDIVIGAARGCWKSKTVAPYSKKDDNHLHVKTLGFLANHGDFIALIPQKDIEKFNRRWLDIKGEMPDEDNKGYQIHVGDAWSSTIRVRFTIPDGLKLEDFKFDPHTEFEIRKGSGRDELNINNITWALDLADMGFGLGLDHDIEEIKSNIPDEYIESFEKGLTIK